MRLPKDIEAYRDDAETILRWILNEGGELDQDRFDELSRLHRIAPGPVRPYLLTNDTVILPMGDPMLGVLQELQRHEYVLAAYLLRGGKRRIGYALAPEWRAEVERLTVASTGA